MIFRVFILIVWAFQISLARKYYKLLNEKKLNQLMPNIIPKTYVRE